MTTVVIAAHNEGAVIGSCLDALLGDAAPGELDVVVAANGCTDDTVAVARSRPGVRVVETTRPGKTAALNAADAVTTGFPRIYLDADIVVPTAGVRRLALALQGPGAALVATPGRTLEVTGRPWPVRAYFAVQRRLPAFDEGLFGRGMIGLSETGRARFDRFPDVVADDLFLDSLFSAGERVRLVHVRTTVQTPLRTRDLVARLVRVRRGNTALRRSGGAAAVRPGDPWSWLRDVVLRRPWLAPAAVPYVAITGWAALQARRSPASSTWGRDESTRARPVVTTGVDEG